MMPRRLTFFVEGRGDIEALPTLARRVLKEVEGYNVLFVDKEPIRASNLGKLIKKEWNHDEINWLRWLRVAQTRHNLAAVLLVLDGDLKIVPSHWSEYAQEFGNRFCPGRVAAILGRQAAQAGAGTTFSVASIFIMKEFEEWLLAGIESLRGKPLAENRGLVPKTATIPSGRQFEIKRDAKRELGRQIPGYQATLDQTVLAQHVDLSAIRERCPSFCRFEKAIQKFVNATREGQSIVIPQI